MKLISKSEFDKLSIYDKGYIAYQQGDWNKNIERYCPFPENSKEWNEFYKGQFDAMMEIVEL